jgi:hypothetical protein
MAHLSSSSSHCSQATHVASPALLRAAQSQWGVALKSFSPARALFLSSLPSYEWSLRSELRSRHSMGSEPSRPSRPHPAVLSTKPTASSPRRRPCAPLSDVSRRPRPPPVAPTTSPSRAMEFAPCPPSVSASSFSAAARRPSGCPPSCAGHATPSFAPPWTSPPGATRAPCHNPRRAMEEFRAAATSLATASHLSSESHAL